MSADGEPLSQSRAFEHLVSDNDDLIGLLSYALYKRDKRDFFVSWREQHGDLPQPDHLKAFATSVLTLGQEMRYRTAARDILDAYAHAVLEAERPIIEREAVSDRFEQAARKLEEAGKWHRQVPAGIVAAGILVVALFVGMLFLRQTGVVAGESQAETAVQTTVPSN